jgi:hypothetical protein
VLSLRDDERLLVAAGWLANTNLPARCDDDGPRFQILTVMGQDIFQQRQTLNARQIFKTQDALMPFVFPPDDLFEVLICGDDDTFFP